MPFTKQTSRTLENLRIRLSSVDALPQLSLLGLIVGLLAGLVIIAFRLLVESSQSMLLPGGIAENFEALTPVQRLTLATIGGFLIGIVLQQIAEPNRRVGIAHVMERLVYGKAQLPWINAAVQFFGAAVSLICGHSVGREGPGVHLGAASASLLGQWLRLPNNSVRILIACGVAGAIAAFFNTPLAGVIFAMEVVLMEYTLLGFTPIILASVSATTVSRSVFGSEPAFMVPPLQLGSLMELPYILATGLFVGMLAAIFIHLLQKFSTVLTDWPLWQKTTTAGIAVGGLAIWVPETMGLGYDTVGLALLGQIGIGLTLAIISAKILASAICVGFGIPGGLIGPTLVIGAGAGTLMGILHQYLPGEYSSHSFYALLGMGAMMGATLQAPLSALTAMLELTANPNVILPGMLAVISAGLVSRELFGKDSAFVMLLRARGIEYEPDPFKQGLQRIGVASIMDRRVIRVPANADIDKLQREIQTKPNWILVEYEPDAYLIFTLTALVQLLQGEPTTPPAWAQWQSSAQTCAPIHFRATLLEALEQMESSKTTSLFVVQNTEQTKSAIYGIITRENIANQIGTLK